jgi:DNA-directed RNA polymerase subunit RPC12/RpoP
MASTSGLEREIPSFLKDLCNDCGKNVNRKVPPSKINCQTCYIRFFAKAKAKREHNFNMKVKVQVVGYHCLDCDYRTNVINDEIPECKGKIDLPRFITPIPFKPANVIEGIHPRKYVPLPEQKIHTVNQCRNADCINTTDTFHEVGDGIFCQKPKKVFRAKAEKKSFSVDEEMPDFLKGF